VLSKLSKERANVGAELVQAAREARLGFGAKAVSRLAATLKTVTVTANVLRVTVGGGAAALLDAHSHVKELADGRSLGLALAARHGALYRLVCFMVPMRAHIC